MHRVFALLLAVLAGLAGLAGPAAAQTGAPNGAPALWQAQYPLAPNHPIVAEGWAAMAEALKPEIDLHLRLIGPRLGSAEALEALGNGTHQMGMLALSSYPQDFPTWAMLSELFLVGGESLAAAAAITDLVMRDCPECQASFARRNLVFLGTYGAAAYCLIAPDAVTEADSLKQHTVATPGSVWDRLVMELGGTVAAVEPDHRAALAAGRATALIDIAAALSDPQLVHQTLTVTKLQLGGYRGASPYLVNREAWRGLSTAQRQRVFAAAATGLVRITQAYHRSAEVDLAAARERGVASAEGGQPLQETIRRFALADQARVAANAEHRFGVTGADRFVSRLQALYERYAALLGPSASEADAIALLTSEIFDRLDAETYGLP